MQTCPCGSNKAFDKCCGVFISGEEDPATPEELMRSRYTAFAKANMQYIADTMDPQTRMQFDVKANQKWADESTFEKLEIIATESEGNKGIVEFKATFRDAEKKTHVHHEIAKFRKQAGIWFFRDGKVTPEAES